MEGQGWVSLYITREGSETPPPPLISIGVWHLSRRQHQTSQEVSKDRHSRSNMAVFRNGHCYVKFAVHLERLVLENGLSPKDEQVSSRRRWVTTTAIALSYQGLWVSLVIYDQGRDGSPWRGSGGVAPPPSSAAEYLCFLSPNDPASYWWPLWSVAPLTRGDKLLDSPPGS